MPEAKREAKKWKRFKPYCCLGGFNWTGSNDALLQGAVG
jgi:hypothetical protein